MTIHSKSEKVCGTAFSVKKNCGSFLGHFGSLLGHFRPCGAILGYIWTTLGHFWPFLGHFVAFLDKFAESSNFFAAPLGSRDSLLECMCMTIAQMLSIILQRQRTCLNI